MAEMFSGMPGRFVELADTIEGFGQLLEGAGDDYPESSFYMVGGLKEALSKK
jgi:F0F1-type ATP synthase beta subunit